DRDDRRWQSQHAGYIPTPRLAVCRERLGENAVCVWGDWLDCFPSSCTNAYRGTCMSELWRVGDRRSAFLPALWRICLQRPLISCPAAACLGKSDDRPDGGTTTLERQAASAVRAKPAFARPGAAAGGFARCPVCRQNATRHRPLARVRH